MSAALTPARQQYLEIKARYPDVLLWFRLGDFYEMFDEDARIAAAALRITLTSRQFGKDLRVPMCGVPYHAQARFLARLVRQGFSVAICEQTSQPGRGLVEREVVRVVTPGTISEPEVLRPGENNYLAAVTRRHGVFALAYVDVSTGEFAVTQTEDEQAVLTELERLQAAECLVDGREDLPPLPVKHRTVGDAALWDREAAADRLRRHLGTQALHVAGCEGRPAAQAAAGAILGYLERTNRALLPVLHVLRPYTIDDAVAIDPTTRTMLIGKYGGERDGSMHQLLDRTVTPLGARLLTRWLRRPLRDRAVLEERLAAIEELHAQEATRQQWRVLLRQVGDLERITARIGQERAGAEDLLALCRTLEVLPELIDAAGRPGSVLLRTLVEQIDPAPDIAAAIRAAVAEPGAAQLIRTGYDREIDAAAAAAVEAKQQLAGMEQAERVRTGIKSLKVSYNQVFGYYIEVTKPNLARVPAFYVRKQTLAHAERFVTPELLAWEAKLKEAEGLLADLDQARFLQLLHGITAEAARLLQSARALAHLDVLASAAEVAALYRFVRPQLTDGTELRLIGAWHPLVEQAVGPGAFIPNDCILGGGEATMAIVTGPNMGGKSTYLRQTALVVYLAQAGLFVPAAAACIGLADRIFARVGAHDDLAAGQSTFLVEMAETAAIVRLATPHSLVLLDEIGRGTTSADGMAIARAVAEYLHEIVAARTLFATHYYEVAREADRWAQARNLHVRAEEHEGKVVFLYRIEEGVADRSFALHVAAMAGMPAAITARAADLLASLQQQRSELPLQERQAEQDALAADEHLWPYEAPRPTLRLAEAEEQDLTAALLGIDLAATTPLEALNQLFALQQRARAHAARVSPRLERAAPRRS